ncbi:MAG TPA: hypothetical protein VFB45_15415 [Pseudolabrys sp.]|nr:hypothetical protein [Pseudolabrys sp.]
MPAPQEQQIPQKKYIVFNEIETMDTQGSRYDLPSKAAAWLENLQPISKNRLQIMPAPIAALTTLTGEIVTKKFYANYGGVDYVVEFCQSGAAYQVNLSNGAQVKFALAGTFTNPDMTQWQSSRILIADPTAGYSTWDGTVFVKPGGLSPNFTITAGGSGYSSGATVGFSGGSGSGAAGTVTVVGGVVTGIVLTNAGSGYHAGDTITVTISPVSGGSGATATGKVWPILSISPTTIAVFQGRVWLAAGRALFWTGTGGFDDSSAGNASGQTTLSDADLVHSITALRALNNYLFIFGDASIKQIGTIAVSGSTTLFTIITLSSDQGTTFPQSIASYNRLVLFANTVGVYAIFGASVQKISDKMDGIFQATDFSQPLQAALNDINNIRCYLLLARYIDPVQGERSIMMVFQNEKWFVTSQGNGLRAICSAIVGGVYETFGSSGSDVTQLIQSTTTAISFLLRTALSSNGNPHQQKRAQRIGVAQSSASQGNVTLTADSENGSQQAQYSVSNPIQWTNNVGSVVAWLNNSNNPVTFVGVGFLWQRQDAKASGITLGATLSGSLFGYTINAVVVEYEDSAPMVSTGAR